MSKKIPKWATVNPWKISHENRATLNNLVDGKWLNSKKKNKYYRSIKWTENIKSSLFR